MVEIVNPPMMSEKESLPSIVDFRTLLLALDQAGLVKRPRSSQLELTIILLARVEQAASLHSDARFSAAFPHPPDWLHCSSPSLMDPLKLSLSYKYFLSQYPCVHFFFVSFKLLFERNYLEEWLMIAEAVVLPTEGSQAAPPLPTDVLVDGLDVLRESWNSSHLAQLPIVRPLAARHNVGVVHGRLTLSPLLQISLLPRDHLRR